MHTSIRAVITGTYLLAAKLIHPEIERENNVTTKKKKTLTYHKRQLVIKIPRNFHLLV